jgi:hypothetical protein
VLNHHREAVQGCGLGSLWGLVQTWWASDRIRISPREGRLLRLAPGALLGIEGEMLEVTQRTVHDLRSGPLVRYACRSADGDSELWVAALPELTIVWTRIGRDRRLRSDDLEIWAPDREFSSRD